MGIYKVYVQKNESLLEEISEVNRSQSFKKLMKILIVYMSAIFNLDYCIEECSQMNFCIEWTLWIV